VVLGVVLKSLEAAPGVLEVAPFLTVEVCRETIRTAESSSGWVPAYIANYGVDNVLAEYVDVKERDALVLGPAAIPEICSTFQSQLEDSAGPIVQHHWGIEGLAVRGVQLVKYQRGGHIRPHKDTASGFSSRCVSAVCYLNDDFEGGELAFPDLPHTYRPRAAALLLFPSDYNHGVLPIRTGRRYAFVAFFVAQQKSMFHRILGIQPPK
jgi:hypothetical protein